MGPRERVCRLWIIIGLFLVCALLVVPGKFRRKTGNVPLFKGTGGHWRRNYGRRSFLRLGGATALAGILAYSGIDEAVEEFHSGTIKSENSDKVSHGFKIFGERFWFLNWALLAATDAWVRTNPLTRLGRSSFEAMVVGLPLLWTVQRGLGANRPSSDDGSPQWRPMNADNSASGHTFIAAVPLLVAANQLPWKPAAAISRGLSVATGWSRINDRKHYLSQVVLGWTIAWNAVQAVSGETELIHNGGDQDDQ